MLAFSGPMTVSSLGLTDRALRDLDDSVTKIDVSAVTVMDTVGAWTVWRLSRDTGADIIGCKPEPQKLIDAIRFAITSQATAAAFNALTRLNTRSSRDQGMH